MEKEISRRYERRDSAALGAARSGPIRGDRLRNGGLGVKLPAAARPGMGVDPIR